MTSTRVTRIIANQSRRYARSQSRMRGDYLFYEEKIETTPEEKEAKAARRYVNPRGVTFYSHD